MGLSHDETLAVIIIPVLIAVALIIILVSLCACRWLRKDPAHRSLAELVSEEGGGGHGASAHHTHEDGRDSLGTTDSTTALIVQDVPASHNISTCGGTPLSTAMTPLPSQQSAAHDLINTSNSAPQSGVFGLLGRDTSHSGGAPYHCRSVSFDRLRAATSNSAFNNSGIAHNRSLTAGAPYNGSLGGMNNNSTIYNYDNASSLNNSPSRSVMHNSRKSSLANNCYLAPHSYDNPIANEPY